MKPFIKKLFQLRLKQNRLSIVSNVLVAMIYFQHNALAVVNSLTIKEEDGVATANYPIQIGRPFVPGEIINFPQAEVNGSPVFTQADVKQRWPDGSVKHAIISFLIPNLPANGVVTITFRDQSTGNNSFYLDASAMLQSIYDFDAQMELNNGSTTLGVSARTMVQNNSFVYWMQGGVATSIIIADHSATRIYDVGFDAHKSFRPIFHATFFPVVNKVRVRFIGEIANTEAIQDMVYSLVLKTGNASPSIVYSKSTFTHYGGSRWTKEFWIGGAPSRISINHNLKYLRETLFFPNWDTAKVIPSSVIAADYAAWQTALKDIFDNGLWMKTMGAGGARPEIGPTTSWAVQWLYTGDIRSQEISFGHANLAPAWPVHFREGNPNKKFLRNNPNVSGLGKPISITDRPSTCFECGYNYVYTSPQDKIIPVGTWTDGGWLPDDAHQPDICSPHYILTGDYFYLEEMYFWASWSAHYLNGAATMYSWGRGPTGSEGGLTGQIRAQAWVFRNRALAAFCAPDGTDEKTYFDYLTKDAIEIWEGAHNLQTTNSSSTIYQWGKQYRYDSVNGNPAQNQWERGSPAFAQSNYGIDVGVTEEAVSNFEQHYLMWALGRGKEMGYSTDSCLFYLAKYYINVMTNPNYNRYLLCNGRVPTIKKSTGQWFISWADLKTGYDSLWQNKSSYDLLYPYDYTFLGLAALSYVKCHANGGDSAWAKAEVEILPAACLNSDPKFAIVPRDCFSSPTNVSQNDLSDKILIYPNPSHGNLQVVNHTQISSVEVYNLLGEKIYSLGSFGYSTIHIFLPPILKQGVYFLKINMDNLTITKPIIIQ